MVPVPPRRPRFRAWRSNVAVALLVIVLALYVYYRRTFPYGVSHCCDLALLRSLEEYAGEHDGAFPVGGPTPEASFSLLCSSAGGVPPDLLRGRTVSEATVKEALKRDGRLGPDSCGWHYIEGLRLDDDPRLAIFWDKIGLGHNGERLSRPGHTALFVGGDRRFIPESGWQAFLSEQAQLLQQRTNAFLGVSENIEVGGERVRVELRVVGDSLYGRVWHGWVNTYGTLIANMDRAPEVGDLSLPVVTTDEIKKATANVDAKASSIKFLIGKQECVFDGHDFRFVTR